MIERIRELLRAREWQPFTIHLVGGDSIYVRTRDHVWVTPSWRLVFERKTGQIDVVGPDQMDQITGVELKSMSFGEIESQTG
ncbi:MAG: hypothetical protein JO275_08950 [Verrucomicrobia bacterium]|nr:hypothetical protein [Verrucomicrobiota bacterium]